jgi:hypothetical protein
VSPVATALVIAIVAQDPTALRALPREGSPRIGQLASGQWLEVREERAGYLKVWDHQHERPGYVRASQVRTCTLDETSAPALAAVIAFLKDSSGSESLGIGYVAAFLKAAPASAVGADAFDALGSFAERLARRASARRAADETLAAQLEVAAGYGVKFVTFEHQDRSRICYDGEAFRRLLALGGTPEQRLRAALSLTTPACVDPALGQAELLTVQEWQRDVLEKVVDPAAPPGPIYLANRVRMRLSAVQSQLAFQYSRRGEAKKSSTASAQALRQLALVEKLELGDEDEPIYQETAIRAATARWQSADSVPARAGIELRIKPGAQPGESCLAVVADGKALLVERCTYSVPHPSSVRASPDGRALTVAVQPLAGWLELWVFRKVGETWEVDPLTPAATEPGLGYVEVAGWSPDSAHLLVVRETKLESGLSRQFQILSATTLEVQKHGDTFEGFGTFRRWHSADWKAGTLALR